MPSIPLNVRYNTYEDNADADKENLTISKILATAFKVVGVFSKRLPALHRFTLANLKFINTKQMENEMDGDSAAEQSWIPRGH